MGEPVGVGVVGWLSVGLGAVGLVGLGDVGCADSGPVGDVDGVVSDGLPWSSSRASED